MGFLTSSCGIFWWWRTYRKEIYLKIHFIFGRQSSCFQVGFVSSCLKELQNKRQKKSSTDLKIQRRDGGSRRPHQGCPPPRLCIISSSQMSLTPPGSQRWEFTFTDADFCCHGPKRKHRKNNMQFLKSCAPHSLYIWRWCARRPLHIYSDK